MLFINAFYLFRFLILSRRNETNNVLIAARDWPNELWKELFSCVFQHYLSCRLFNSLSTSPWITSGKLQEPLEGYVVGESVCYWNIPGGNNSRLSPWRYHLSLVYGLMINCPQTSDLKSHKTHYRPQYFDPYQNSEKLRKYSYTCSGCHLIFNPKMYFTFFQMKVWKINC